VTVQYARRRDPSLIAAVADGSVESFEALYARYVHRAYRVAFAVCRDEGRAEEAVQDAFLSIWLAGAGFSAHRGSVATWLLSIVRYRAIDVARRNGRLAGSRESQKRLENVAARDQAFDIALRHEIRDELQASLDSLPAGQQEVIRLAFFGQLSHAEIAQALELAPGTVKGRMRLGLYKLRDTIEHP
jgi:RNA polymerase sigma-70 factor (ECF subfamily)